MNRLQKIKSIAERNRVERGPELILEAWDTFMHELRHCNDPDDARYLLGNLLDTLSNLADQSKMLVSEIGKHEEQAHRMITLYCLQY